MCYPAKAAGLVAAIPQPFAPGKAVTVTEVQQVHALIEGCLRHYMSLAQTCDTLAELGVDPRFTALVWKRLEAENPDFFATYSKKLDVTATMNELCVGEPTTQ